MLIHEFYPGKDFMSSRQLATRSLVATGLLMIVSVAVAEVARVFVVRRQRLSPPRGTPLGFGA
jgi:CHASE1-domain containing sensor protein